MLPAQLMGSGRTFWASRYSVSKNIAAENQLICDTGVARDGNDTHAYTAVATTHNAWGAVGFVGNRIFRLDDTGAANSFNPLRNATSSPRGWAVASGFGRSGIGQTRKL